MSLRQYLFIMSFAAILCWISWGFVLVNIDPFQGSKLGFFFFYLSFYFALLGTFSMPFFIISRKLTNRIIPLYIHVRRSFTCSVVVSFALVMVLYLNAKKVLTFWNFILLLFIFILLFAFAVSYRKSRRADNFL
ncbi:MAG: hypothetical protein L3J07_01660 [Candidatus Magasanikbacteria bacterium]|nr:hypothetical protein [Candidatus Magasanikbacteria bacterium]